MKNWMLLSPGVEYMDKSEADLSRPLKIPGKHIRASFTSPVFIITAMVDS
uniref:Uncharacterized protein n=1 Tax=Anguilla anguilla TaxID=7936 RepID=A0A0E9WRC2_ANGAN